METYIEYGIKACGVFLASLFAMIWIAFIGCSVLEYFSNF